MDIPVSSLIKAEKFLSSEALLDENIHPANNKKNLYVESELQDQAGVSIAGLTMRIEWKEDAIECNEKYSLYYFVGGRRQRFFQIEVCPLEKLSHRDGSQVFYGPHIHYPLDTPRNITANYGCGVEHRSKWFKRFCRHANITVRSEGQISLLNQWLD